MNNLDTIFCQYARYRFGLLAFCLTLGWAQLPASTPGSGSIDLTASEMAAECAESLVKDADLFCGPVPKNYMMDFDGDGVDDELDVDDDNDGILDVDECNFSSLDQIGFEGTVSVDPADTQDAPRNNWKSDFNFTGTDVDVTTFSPDFVADMTDSPWYPVAEGAAYAALQGGEAAAPHNGGDGLFFAIPQADLIAAGASMNDNITVSFLYGPGYNYGANGRAADEGTKLNLYFGNGDFDGVSDISLARPVDGHTVTMPLPLGTAVPTEEVVVGDWQSDVTLNGQPVTDPNTFRVHNSTFTWEGGNVYFFVICVGAETQKGGAFAGGDYILFDDLKLVVEDDCANTDEEGDINSRDLDSDGDGCNDVIEAGHSDPDNDGVLGLGPPTVDANGAVIGAGGYTGRSAASVDPTDFTACCDITVSATASDESCPGENDGSITAEAECSSCGDGITYTLLQDDNPLATNGTGSFTGLAPGTYAVSAASAGDTSCVAVQTDLIVGAGDAANCEPCVPSGDELVWQMHHGQGMGIYIPPADGTPVPEILSQLYGTSAPQHGDAGGYEFAEIPPADDSGWEAAPIDPEDGELCFRLDRSVLDGYMTGLDFTYFQTTLNVADTTQPFTMRYSQVDDGVRAYVFNARHPNGAFMPGGDARLYQTPVETRLDSLFVVGENRIVLVQFDDSETQNYLKATALYEGGDCDECANDTEPPILVAILADGTEIPALDFVADGFECGLPAVGIAARDNCDPEAIFFEINETPPIQGDGTQEFNEFVVVRDASGNSDTVLLNYIVTVNQAPEISLNVPLDSTGTGTLSDTVNVCNEYPVTAESLGLTVTDDVCPDTLDPVVVISIFDENENQIDSISGPGAYQIVIEATDGSGLLSTATVNLSLAPNPDIYTVTAGDDSFTGIASTAFNFTTADLIGNDNATNGAELSVQEVSVVNPADGTVTDNGDGSFTFTPAPGFTGAAQLTYVVKSADGSLFFDGTGHFYEYVPANGIRWTVAKAEAENRILNGVNGYLATVTSAEENQFIQSRLEGQGWMGGSDAAVDDEWRWVTGPEAGTLFYVGKGDAGGMAVDGAYVNWQVNEPNDFEGDNEQYAHFRTTGEWNDLPDVVAEIQGYVVEYGGVDGCIPPNFSATGNIVINYPTGDGLTGKPEALRAVITPNPFQGEANLTVVPTEDTDLDIVVRNSNGNVVHRVKAQGMKDVANPVNLSLGGLTPGLYFITIQSSTSYKTIRAHIVR